MLWKTNNFACQISDAESQTNILEHFIQSEEPYYLAELVVNYVKPFNLTDESKRDIAGQSI